jgi:hypothetical protein
MIFKRISWRSGGHRMEGNEDIVVSLLYCIIVVLLLYVLPMNYLDVCVDVVFAPCYLNYLFVL